MSKEVMNAKEVAEYLSLAESTIYKKVEYRDIPYVKVGSLLRFPKWVIDQWLTSRVVRPHESIFDEFIRLNQRYHLKHFLQAKGLGIEGLNEDQLVIELRHAIEDLKAHDEE